MNAPAAVKRLGALDPRLADRLEAAMARHPEVITGPVAEAIVETIVWGIDQELRFGEACAEGLLRLAETTDQRRLDAYIRAVTAAGAQGPVLGRILACALVPVLQDDGPDLATRFDAAVAAMREKGTYALADPMDALMALFSENDRASVLSYLDLLVAVYRQPLTYNRSVRLSKVVPRAVRGMPADGRSKWIDALCAVVTRDERLTETFLDGLDRGLSHLRRDALNRYVHQGLDLYRRHPEAGADYLGLTSRAAISDCAGLQVAVPFIRVRRRLERYLHARLGPGVTVRSFTDLPKHWQQRLETVLAFTLGRTVYVPDTLDRFDSAAENARLFQDLVRLEAGAIECGSYFYATEYAAPSENEGLDLAAFFSSFPDPGLAAALFTAFEHGRIRYRLKARYPGLFEQTDPQVAQALRHMVRERPGDLAFLAIYAQTALGAPIFSEHALDAPARAIVLDIAARFQTQVQKESPVSVSADLVAETFSAVAGILSQAHSGQVCPLSLAAGRIPFGRLFIPEIFADLQRGRMQSATRLQARLEAAGMPVSRMAVLQMLTETDDTPTTADLARLTTPDGRGPTLSEKHLDGLVDSVATVTADDDVDGSVFRYPEWDMRQGDYRAGHVRVREVICANGGNGDFYEDVLSRHAGLVRRIRHAFEFLRPQGLKLLRRFTEGDQFDYRALIDAVLDRRAGLPPSERLYTKRVKQHRDVAVLLLVDLSRSTANTVLGSSQTVIDLEKQAIVLLCEALDVVGDAFAVAGFSGTGRLGVDYCRIKDFDTPLNSAVKGRIQAMVPQRSTRMGAAIRHAVTAHAAVESAVKLLMVLGDGFPNDVDYKHRYAIEDTRKAVSEALAVGVITHGITVNIAADPRLDDLYGPRHHTLISDVRELPERLWRIYSALTR